MANRIPIEADEVIDYVIEGIPDPRLRDQARLQRFKDTAELVEAFENITLRSNPKIERSSAGTSQQKPKKEMKPATTERAESSPASRGIKCFNCKEKGHRAADCTKPKTAANKPIAAQLSDSTKQLDKASTEMNLIQPFVGTDPYTVPVSYTVSDNKSNAHLFSCTTIPGRRLA